jgi:7,8-dihydro-6-hydroxymethylpterin-pyrophosphokinase
MNPLDAALQNLAQARANLDQTTATSITRAAQLSAATDANATAQANLAAAKSDTRAAADGLITAIQEFEEQAGL